MKVPLPSGHVAELRDTLLRGDVRDARKGIVVVISPDGSRRSDGSFLDDITGRLITRMLVDWTLDKGAYPLPSTCQTQDLAQAVLDKLDEDDYAALEKAVGPWVEKLLSREKADTFTHVPTGVRVTPASEADAKALEANPDFARDGDAAGPKTASRAIGTSS